ncbi:MAG: ABC transporter ATP-binding protein [Chloroflexota bacterium]|nr:ABC transporter ATP-binding protein [Chloroflexota bacterium]
MRKSIRRALQVLAVYRGVPRSVWLIAEAAPLRVLAMVLIYVIFSAVGPAGVWFSKLLVDALVAQQAALAITLAVLYTGLRIVGTAAGWLYEPVYAGFRDRFVFHLQSRLMQKASSMPDLSLFETPAFYDKLQNARRAMDAAQRLIATVITGFSIILVFLTLVGMLASLHPLAAAIVVVSTLPSYLARLRFGHGYWQVYRGQAPHVRRLDYFFQLLTTEAAAKEIRLFGLSDWFLGLYRRTYRQVLGHTEAFRRRQAFPMIGFPSIGSVGAGGVLVYLVWQASLGHVSVGDLVLYLGAIFLIQDTVRSVLDNFSTLYEAQLHTSNIVEFLALEAPMQSPVNGQVVPLAWRERLEVRAVSFRYPGMDRPVLNQVSFTIRPGERLALVGHNGAGKTTLVKLLCRLYDPTAGHILLDGRDLREYDLADWRRTIAVVFQDYAKYHLTASQNIGLADLDRINDRAAISAAARAAAADDVIAALPRGPDTLLGRQFEHGVELSIGQWQKIALARAFFRDAPLLILDEPTAALDAETEYAVYRRFRDLTHGRTTLIISHRFSTVRMADRILVLQDGRLVEQGPHEDLIAAQGIYAAMYEKQASRYR